MFRMFRILFLVLSIFGFMSAQELKIGSKMHTEAQVLTELTTELLESHGYKVEKVGNFQSLIARKASLNNQFDMYYDYTGTAYALYLKKNNKDVLRDKNRLYSEVKKSDAKNSLVWLEPLNINNTYTIMLRESEAKRLGIVSISDLAEYINLHPKDLTLGVNPEFWERPDGMKELMKEYGFRIPRSNVKLMDAGLMYISLKESKIDIAMGYATDGRIKAFDLKNLVDDKDFFPVYNPALVINKEYFSKNPKIEEILKPMWEKLNEENIREMNYQVSGDKKSPKEVARKWLKDEGL